MRLNLKISCVCFALLYTGNIIAMDNSDEWNSGGSGVLKKALEDSISIDSLEVKEEVYACKEEKETPTASENKQDGSLKNPTVIWQIIRGLLQKPKNLENQAAKDVSLCTEENEIQTEFENRRIESIKSSFEAWEIVKGLWEKRKELDNQLADALKTVEKVQEDLENQAVKDVLVCTEEKGVQTELENRCIESMVLKTVEKVQEDLENQAVKDVLVCTEEKGVQTELENRWIESIKSPFEVWEIVKGLWEKRKELENQLAEASKTIKEQQDIINDLTKGQVANSSDRTQSSDKYSEEDSNSDSSQGNPSDLKKREGGGVFLNLQTSDSSDSSDDSVGIVRDFTNDSSVESVDLVEDFTSDSSRESEIITLPFCPEGYLGCEVLHGIKCIYSRQLDTNNPRDLRKLKEGGVFPNLQTLKINSRDLEILAQKRSTKTYQKSFAKRGSPLRKVTSMEIAGNIEDKELWIKALKNLPNLEEIIFVDKWLHYGHVVNNLINLKNLKRVTLQDDELIQIPFEFLLLDMEQITIGEKVYNQKDLVEEKKSLNQRIFVQRENKA